MTRFGRRMAARLLATGLAAVIAATPASAVISYEFVGQPFNRLQAFVFKSPGFIASPSDIVAARLDSCLAAFAACDRVLLFETGSSLTIQFFEVDLVPFSYFFPGARLDQLGFYQTSPANGLLGLLNITGTVDDPPPPPPPPPPGPGIPEPATWALLVAGFGLTGAALRRRPAAFRSGAR